MSKFISTYYSTAGSKNLLHLVFCLLQNGMKSPDKRCPIISVAPVGHSFISRWEGKLRERFGYECHCDADVSRYDI